MRDIEFRGISHTTGDFVYGFLYRDRLGSYITTEKEAHHVRAETVGQFTGIKDIDGIRLYTGDKVSYGDRTATICWGRWSNGLEWDDFDKGYGYYLKDSQNGEYDTCIDSFKLKKIGTIHDEPFTQIRQQARRHPQLALRKRTPAQRPGKAHCGDAGAD